MVQQAPFVKPHYVLIVAAATVLLIARRSASDACKDSGSAQLASAVDMAGAVAALFCALPLFSSFLNTVEGLL